MEIGDLSRRTGVSVRLLRYYEQQGLLHPARSGHGYRVFSDGDVDVVGRIRLLLRSGPGTRDIRRVLSCLHGVAPGLTASCPEAVRQLDQQRRSLQQDIAALRDSARLLERIARPEPAAAGGAGSRAALRSAVS